MEASLASHQIIADLLAVHTGQQLTESRRWRIDTALSGVFRQHGISNLDQLVCLLEDQGSFSQKQTLAQQVVEALLNNETYFFRDKPTFDQLSTTILPELAARRESTKRLSIWSAGCSTGQEAHSIAMMIADAPHSWRDWTIEIVGTDISQRAISLARRGLYSQFEVQRGLGVAQMLKHFEETRDGWQIDTDIARMVRFEVRNVLLDPPSSAPFDLILCRNVLLYFGQATRSRVFGRLARALASDGILMLGAGETVIGQTREFCPSPGRTSLYEKQDERASLALDTPRTDRGQKWAERARAGR